MNTLILSWQCVSDWVLSWARVEVRQRAMMFLLAGFCELDLFSAGSPHIYISRNIHIRENSSFNTLAVWAILISTILTHDADTWFVMYTATLYSAARFRTLYMEKMQLMTLLYYMHDYQINQHIDHLWCIISRDYFIDCSSCMCLSELDTENRVN